MNLLIKLHAKLARALEPGRKSNMSTVVMAILAIFLTTLIVIVEHYSHE